MADIPGDATTTATLSVGSSASSAIEVLGDHDWFRISLTAGQPVDILVSLGTLADSYLNIRDSAGNILYSNDDIVDGVNRASEVKFNPGYTGTYYIDVSAWSDPNAPGDGYTGTGTYTVSAKPYTPPPLATNDQIANQLTSGYWGGDVHHWAVTQGGTLTVDIHNLTTAEQSLAIAALQEWTDLIGVTFRQVTSGAQIVFDDGGDPTGKNPVAQTNANWSNGIISSANVEISKSWVSSYGTSLNSYSFQTYIHEIGHALGLGHAGDYNNTANYPYDSLFLNDAWSTSIMSYFSPQENSYFANQGFSYVFAVTPMVADIIAMQTLYGLSTTTRTGDTIYGDYSNAGGIYNAQAYPNVAYTIYDSSGNDTINYSLSSANQLINLNPETFSNVNGYTGNLEIARGVVIENAIGGSGNDTIIANSANDVLSGGAGADSLQGGSGNDTFKDSEANHSGDTITNFHPGDTILFTDATLGNFSFSLSGNTLNFTGGSMTLDGTVGGKFTTSVAASGGIQLVEVATHTKANDFNGDGHSDILWGDANGAIYDMSGTSNGGFVNNGDNSYLNLGANWQVAGTGDFNGDGNVDFLLRNSSTGAIYDMLGTASGGFTNNANASSVNVDSSWKVAGIGDFNGDGHSDILWLNPTTGAIYNFLGTANGGFTNNGDASYVSLSSGWHVAGTGDFNGDGHDDLLLRNDNGAVFDMLGTANGGFTNNGDNSYISAGSAWQVAGIGDFNGDGISDILWRNSTTGTIYNMLGNSVGGFTNNGDASSVNVDNSWHVASIGDFNADGIDDILWRNDSGVVYDFLGTSQGGFVNNGDNSYIAVSTNWHVQDPFA